MQVDDARSLPESAKTDFTRPNDSIVGAPLNLQYIIRFFNGNGESKEDEEPTYLVCDAQPEEVEYFERILWPVFRPLSDEDFQSRFGRSFYTLAHYSYLLSDTYLFLCMELDQGLATFRLLADGQIDLALLPPPNIDDDDISPQYMLAAFGWDAAMMSEERNKEWWKPAPPEAIKLFVAAKVHMDQLVDQFGADHFDVDRQEKIADR